MTDQEIIKALECCAKHYGCMDCPARGKDDCMTNLYKISLSLIEKLKKDIEEWKTNWNELHKITMHRGYILIERWDENQGLKAEVEMLKKENHWFSDLGKMDSEIRAEAVKEFAERLKKEIASGTHYVGILADIDNIVKEMAGEGNG